MHHGPIWGKQIQILFNNESSNPEVHILSLMNIQVSLSDRE